MEMLPLWEHGLSGLFFMRKILFITTIGGFLSQFEMDQVRILQGMGYEVHYASDFNNNFYEFDEIDLIREGVIIHRIDIKKKPHRIISNTKATRQIKEIINKYNIDVIHCNNPLGGVCGRVAAVSSRIKPLVIYTAHGFHFYKGASFINWLSIYPIEVILARFTNVLLTINNEDYRRAMKLDIRKDGFVAKVNGMGVDSKRFKPMPEIREEVRGELNIPNDAFHIVTAAELNDNKNQKVVIEALANCPYKNIYYSMCGIGENRNRLEELINKLGIEDRVKILGYRTDMERVLQSADVFAFPSIREGLGIAGVEALMCDVPVIALDNRGTREYVRHMTNGLVCKNNSVDSFLNAIMCLYENPKFLNKLSANGRQSVKRFSKTSVNNRFKKIYAKIDSLL